MKDINPNFFYAVKLDEECKFKSAVWVDARCRASYEYYGDVVSVDSTYSTNRHGLPFVSFVGVNHHGKSTLLGCALLGNEEITSYEWVFSQWVKCIKTAPQCIITDQCRSIYRAIKNTLPDTRHRWCIWHIMNKLPSKLGGYRRYGALYGDLNDIVWNSQTEESFEDKWADFIDEYNLHDNTWLSDLYDDRRMWVPIYFKGKFWAAMRSTQRSESMHTFYGGYLYSKTSLVQFVHEYDNVLGVMEQRELEDDAADSRGANCRVSAVDEQGPLVCVKVEEEKLVNDTILCVPYDVHFDRSTQELRCECNLFESSEFVGDDDEIALLHVALEETRAKLAAHRAKKRSESVSDTQTNIGSQSSNDVGIDDIQGPSKVTTKGKPKSKRLGYALEKSFKNSRRRKQKNSSPVVRPHAFQDINHGVIAGLNFPDQAGGFMSLLSSFNKK
ncbi:protein FAR1-RELATED SEQUENCE 6-like [Arachis ipaensis]|uniref:protein FAR1-RELATED SEQUENCE 6-like n=1 Tax=Arachis ipaensis TaxID=130454 RepID=UPI000A2B2B24|nr:protein FAR1-RELATED SEQUENCE 6-like [Arachis ipaensis]XP_025627747.1 protein FAR1-RELATED SEQUENCE 6-like [Arachis hypogaea]